LQLGYVSFTNAARSNPEALVLALDVALARAGASEVDETDAGVAPLPQAESPTDKARRLLNVAR
jgi:hypothetical protein